MVYNEPLAEQRLHESQLTPAHATAIGQARKIRMASQRIAKMGLRAIVVVDC